MRAVILMREWQGDNDDDLPTLRPRIYLVPPVELTSSDEDRAACQNLSNSLVSPHLLPMAPLAFEAWSRWRQLPRSTGFFAVILSPEGESMRWVHIELIRKKEGEAGALKCAGKAGRRYPR